MIHRYMNRLRNVASERLSWLQQSDRRRQSIRARTKLEKMEWHPDHQVPLAYQEERKLLDNYGKGRPRGKVSFKGKTKRIEEQCLSYRRESPQEAKPFAWNQNELGGSDDKDCKSLLIGIRDSFDVIQYHDQGKAKSSAKAGMSMVHLMAVPKEPIYNGVSLILENVDIIDDMIKLFKKSWAKREVRDKVLAHQAKTIRNAYVTRIKDIIKSIIEKELTCQNFDVEQMKQVHEELDNVMKLDKHLDSTVEVDQYLERVDKTVKEIRQKATDDPTAMLEALAALEDIEKHYKDLDQYVDRIRNLNNHDIHDETKSPTALEAAQTALGLATTHFGELRHMIHKIRVDEFVYGLHLRPDNSVPYLHMHILAAPNKYRMYSTTAHDEKTKDAYEVKEVINRLCTTKNATQSKI